MKQPSPYSNLTTESCIRLLKIHPRRASSPDNIICSLDELDLASGPDHSIFMAVSYAWGSEDDSKHITLNGEKVVIRNNLYEFLTHARLEGWNRHLWIDALCINQNDIWKRAARLP